MDKAEELRRLIVEGDRAVSSYDKGRGLLLPEVMTCVTTKPGDRQTQQSVKSLLDNLARHSAPQLILLLDRKEDGWHFFPSLYGDTEYPLGEWWPAFLDAAVCSWIKAIPTYYVGLDLNKLIEITKHLGWDQVAVDDFDGTPRQDLIYPWLWLCCNFSYELGDNGMVTIDHSDKGWKPRDSNWYRVIEALQKRFEALTVKIDYQPLQGEE